MPDPVASLEVCRGGTPLRTFVLTPSVVTIGRAPDNVLTLNNDPTVSRHHARITRMATGYVLSDLGSADGTYVNGDKLASHTAHNLSQDTLIGIGCFELRFRSANMSDQRSHPPSFGTKQTTVVSPEVPQAGGPTVPSQRLDLRGRDTLSIGRDALNDMTIDHPAVSRFHAQIKRQQDSHVICDLNSTNGTFVNGTPIIGRQVLRVGDTIRIGPTNLNFNINESLIQINEEGNLSIDAVNLNQRIGKGINLLNNLSLSIQAREFVAIAGVSGGGKSTLLDALNGFRPATSGAVLVNGTNLYKNFNAYRTEIGYVPQRDIVHMELTVAEALDYAAQLRMPADTTRAERRARINQVLADLGLTQRRDVPIKALSGGQIKRVSIGVELLTKPSLFFLDEATSGLDPGTEAELMQLLRQLTDQGRTIVLITHATENVTLCDQVVFMARGGNIAYFGPPQQATQYFGVEKFNQIYRKVEHDLSPEQWQQRYLQSPHFQQYIASRQQSLASLKGQRTKPLPRHPSPGAQVKRISSWRQFLVLSRRNLTILLRDRASLILMLAVAPVLGLLDLFAWTRNLFDVQTGDASLAITMLFSTGLTAVMVGGLSTMREIVKEQDIYCRERVVGLQIIPYILSKVWVSVLLALYQAAVFLGFKFLGVDLPVSLAVVGGMYITLVLVSIAGMIMGLLTSAIAPNQNVAPLLAIILLIPQMIFGGGLLPVDSYGPPGQLMNHISIAKWPFEALMTITGVGRDIAQDACWALPEQDRAQLNSIQKQACPCLGPSILRECEFPGIQDAYTPAVDQPEPVKPSDPGEPPPQPQQQTQAALIKYQTDVAAYLSQVADYHQALDRWQQQYRDWKEQNEGAIGRAEGIINRFHQNFGATFDVNVPRHWAILVVLSTGMLGLTVAVQKFKDSL